MCGHVTQGDLITLHHEMTHIEYFLEYRNLHKAFRDGANPGKPFCNVFHSLFI